MSEFHTVKLAARGARLHLNNDECKVIIDKYNPKDILVTAPGIFIHDNQECVKIPALSIIVPVTDITKLEVGNHFNPNIHTMMEIAWED